MSDSPGHSASCNCLFQLGAKQCYDRLHGKELKTYRASVGFFDLAIAAPSMKAAPEAWGSNTNLFHQGVAKQVADPEVVAAMSKQGLVLKRPVGLSGPFKEHASVPTQLPRDDRKGRPGKPGTKPKDPPARPMTRQHDKLR